MRFSPTDQRFVIRVEAGAVVALVCAITAGVGCIIAGFAGGTSVARIAYYYNWACWMELKVSYRGSIQGFNRYWRC